jgi:DDE family transposase
VPPPSSDTPLPPANATFSSEPQPTDAEPPIEIYGDSSYGTAQFVETIEKAGAEANVKVQAPSAPEGKFAKDAFDIDLANNTVRCPAGVLVVIRRSTSTGEDGLRLASFGVHCNSCELRSGCTDGKEGRTIRVHPREATLQRARHRQSDPSWKARYRATRPKVERKIGHLMHKRHGGRCARVRGCARVAHDFSLLAAAHNLRRLARLGVYNDGSTWKR